MELVCCDLVHQPSLWTASSLLLHGAPSVAPCPHCHLLSFCSRALSVVKFPGAITVQGESSLLSLVSESPSCLEKAQLCLTGFSLTSLGTDSGSLCLNFSWAPLIPALLRKLRPCNKNFLSFCLHLSFLCSPFLPSL